MSNIEQTDIILFHIEGETYLKKIVFKNLDYRIFDPLNDVKYNFKTIIKALVDSLILNFALFVKSFLSIRQAKNFFKKCKAVHIANQLRVYEPKVIITFVDNCTIFHLVCEAYEEVPFLAIQNGGRYSWCVGEALPDPDLKYHIDEYFCFGPYVENLFKIKEHAIKKYITCGSLLGGYYFCNNKSLIPPDEKKYDMCMISQYKSQFFLDLNLIPVGLRRLGEALDFLTGFVARFAKENSIKVCIALRSNTLDELNYYLTIFNGNCVFKKYDQLNFSSYQAATESKMVLALNSTLASEVFGVGIKVLFVNPFGERYLKPTSQDGIWCLSEPTYEDFSGRVTEVLDMENDEYIRISKKEMQNVMSYNFDFPAHKVIRERLIQLIK